MNDTLMYIFNRHMVYHQVVGFACFFFFLFTKRKHNFCIYIAAKLLQLHKSPSALPCQFLFSFWVNRTIDSISNFPFNRPVYRSVARSNNFVSLNCSNDEYICLQTDVIFGVLHLKFLVAAIVVAPTAAFDVFKMNKGQHIFCKYASCSAMSQ